MTGLTDHRGQKFTGPQAEPWRDGRRDELSGEDVERLHRGGDDQAMSSSRTALAGRPPYRSLRPVAGCEVCAPGPDPVDPVDPAHPVKVLAQSGDPVSQAGLSGLLHGRAGIELVPPGREADADLVLKAAAEFTVPVMNRLRSLRAEPGQLRIVLVLERLGDPDLMAAAELGVAGFVNRSQATGEHLTRVLTIVHQGGTHLPREIQARLLADVARVQRTVLAPRRLTASGLDHREVEVLRCIAEGLENAEIAQRMQYSERTVKSILYALMERLQLRNRSHAVAFAMRAGVL
ncbi:response regulator transcription factor [Kineosporia rhizophila]|uniref:helix-turn-helix transcriptional regulator n=1 Tax=Kineosporia rhizophila TaxID=84633 RepID=UPI001E51AE10|nr:response regulator transcription factor [Kineosporia rhizophila]MCE0537925.1 response regulator transcription factor [Kineosporia rhizophila]